jgi:hypothetical protein
LCLARSFEGDIQFDVNSSSAGAVRLALRATFGGILESDGALELVSAVSLSEFRDGTHSDFAPYAVTADGQRFLINAVIDKEPNAPLAVVVNWAAEINKGAK